MYSATRNDVKQLAHQIETLAKAVQSKLETGGDYLSVANELVRNNSTFVFALGEVYALEQVGVKSKKVKVTKVTSANRNYHNVRDNVGRFTRKV